MPLRLDVTGKVESSAGDGWPQARLLVADDGRAAVWHGQRTENTLVWSGLVADVEGSGPWTLTADDGTVLTATRAGCGCGTRLPVLDESDIPAGVAT